MLVLLLTLLLMAPAMCQKPAKDCEEYQAELRSRPDFSHRVVTSSLALPPDFVITSMHQDVTKGRSFYWCEMQVKEGTGRKVFRHYGHNATTWWVSKGCGGWFTITACRLSPSPSPSVSNNGDNVDPYVTPTIVTIVSADGHDQQPKQQHRNEEGHPTGALSAAYPSQRVNDINSGELQSLYQWLAELGTPIHEKLGGSPNRVARSVDEEFVAEFGY